MSTTTKNVAKKEQGQVKLAIKEAYQAELKASGMKDDKIKEKLDFVVGRTKTKPGTVYIPTGVVGVYKMGKTPYIGIEVYRKEDPNKEKITLSLKTVMGPASLDDYEKDPKKPLDHEYRVKQDGAKLTKQIAPIGNVTDEDLWTDLPTRKLVEFAQMIADQKYDITTKEITYKGVVCRQYVAKNDGTFDDEFYSAEYKRVMSTKVYSVQ